MKYFKYFLKPINSLIYYFFTLDKEKLFKLSKI